MIDIWIGLGWTTILFGLAVYYTVPFVCLIVCPSFIDVIGVCKTVEQVTRLTTKSNREVTKRTLELMDMSGKVVTVTLWGEDVSI